MHRQPSNHIRASFVTPRYFAGWRTPLETFVVVMMRKFRKLQQHMSVPEGGVQGGSGRQVLLWGTP